MPSIRLARIEDCPEILGIYGYFVENTAVTFEYEVPTLGEMEGRMKNILLKYPYLVSVEAEKVIGFAYAADFRHRAAYQWSCECTVYIAPEHQGKGTGRLLYQRLLDMLRLQGYFNVFAGVAIPNERSIRLHQQCSFEEIGEYRNIGYKRGVWHTTRWFQLVLREHSVDPAPPKRPDEIMNTPEYQLMLT
jgi:L-amino acid N-acyltransferase YncA